jgi:hypothetical protein
MSAPERLLSGEATDFERELLGSWQARQPSPEARAKTLARVGIGIGAMALTATTAKTAGGSIAPKAIVATSTLMKWLALGAVGATLTGGTIGYIHHVRHVDVTESTGSAEAASPPDVHTRAQNAPSSSSSPSAAIAVPPIELGPETVPLPKAAKGRPSLTVPKSTLDDEVAMIAEARHAEASGNSAAALDLLNTYDLRYPLGSLAQESTEIRIGALIQQGNRPAAERLAARFIATHPSSLDVRNIRRALDPVRP